jgi:uncharacterized membrane protein YhaH (DUF805 family)
VIRFLTFRGRAARDALLLFLFFTGLGQVALRHWLGESPVWPGPIANPYPLLHAAPWRIAVEAVYTLALLQIAVARFHDCDRRGWWVLSFVAFALSAPWAGYWHPWIGTALGYFALPGWAALLAWPGTIGPNRFGPDPRGWASAEHFDRQSAALAAEAEWLTKPPYRRPATASPIRAVTLTPKY